MDDLYGKPPKVGQKYKEYKTIGDISLYEICFYFIFAISFLYFKV